MRYRRFGAATLAELTYEQAQKALEQQERQVNELRQRTGTLLGAAALTASFFGAATLGRDGVGIPVFLAGIALAAGPGRSRYCEVLMGSKPNTASAPKPPPPALPSQGIPPVSPSVFIPEKRGANPPQQG
jgi:hypothetical protein